MCRSIGFWNRGKSVSISVPVDRTGIARVIETLQTHTWDASDVPRSRKNQLREDFFDDDDMEELLGADLSMSRFRGSFNIS